MPAASQSAAVILHIQVAQQHERFVMSMHQLSLHVARPLRCLGPHVMLLNCIQSALKAQSVWQACSTGSRPIEQADTKPQFYN